MIQYKVNSLLRNNSEKTVLKKENIIYNGFIKKSLVNR